MHAIEAGWLERFRRCELYAYQFTLGSFEKQDPKAGYWIARTSVEPLTVEPVRDLLERHADAGIEFRVVNTLWPLIDAISASDLQFSISRKSNARPRE